MSVMKRVTPLFQKTFYPQNDYAVSGSSLYEFKTFILHYYNISYKENSFRNTRRIKRYTSYVQTTTINTVSNVFLEVLFKQN